jgi:hypothetical protein
MSTPRQSEADALLRLAERIERANGDSPLFISTEAASAIRSVLRREEQGCREGEAIQPTVATLPVGELVALRRDAARYRWLLATLGDQLHGKPSLDAAWDDDIDDWRSAHFFRLSDAEAINAAIDAAIQSNVGEGRDR